MNKPLIFVLLALAPSFGFQRSEDPSRIFVIGAKGGYVMGSPELACATYALGLAWTKDGDYLIAERIVVPETVTPRDLLIARQRDDLKGLADLSRRRELVAWNLRSRRSKTIFTYDPASLDLGRVRSIPNSDRVYVGFEEELFDPIAKSSSTREGYLLFTLGTGAALRIVAPDPTRSMSLEFSAKGLGAVTQSSEGGKPSTVTFFGHDGRFGRTFPLPNRAMFAFEESGAPTLGIVVTDAKGKRRMQFHRFDPASGALGAVVEPKFADDGEATPEVGSGMDDRAERSIPEIEVSDALFSPQARGIVLRVAPGKKENVGIVTSDGSEGILSPRNDAVAYLSGGSAFVRTITKLSPQDLASAQTLVTRQKAMDRGHQIGLGLAMYAADADDVMPPVGDNINESVFPYVKNRDVFEGFVYTFGGALPQNGRDTLEVGYIPIAGGRVVVHADGSVAWAPDGG